MRIITGKYRGKRIVAPKGLPVRPTTDQAKEAIFNIIINNFVVNEIKVLDLFAGTGNISYEFCSRGAGLVTAVEKDHRCYSFINKTAELLGFENMKIIRADVFKFLKSATQKFDLIFADPPYDMDKIKLIPELVLNNKLLNENGWLIIEHSKIIDFTDNPNFSEQRRYGKVNFSIFL